MTDILVPPEIYLDTSVVIAALHPGTPNAVACAAYVQQLGQRRSEVYFSQALRLDLGRAFRRLATKQGNLPQAERDAFKLDQWGTNPLIRQRWLIREMHRFHGFLTQFSNVVEIPLSTAVWRESLEVMAVDGLDATDALHVAAARAVGLEVLATSDRDFRRIASPRIHLIRDADGG